MAKTYTLGCSGSFLSEKQTEPYKWYGEGSIAGENDLMRQELQQASSSAGWQAGEVCRF